MAKQVPLRLMNSLTICWTECTLQSVNGHFDKKYQQKVLQSIPQVNFQRGNSPSQPSSLKFLIHHSSKFTFSVKLCLVKKKYNTKCDETSSHQRHYVRPGGIFFINLH